MSYRLALPDGGDRQVLDLVEPWSSAVQRAIRRYGLGGYEPTTMAAILAVADSQARSGEGVTFVDIGANIGLYSHLVASMFSGSSVHAFEPTPTTAKTARRIARRNRLPIAVNEVAVGARPGRATLYLSATSDASNSLAEGFKKSIGEIDVEVTTLDEYCGAHGLRPTLVKLDVESLEPEVLAGAKRTISTARPVIVLEVLARRNRDFGAAITEAMDPHGYHYHPLTTPITWRTHPRIVARPRPDERDWLLTPDPIGEAFGEQWGIWRSRLDECGVDKNPRPPLFGAARVAYRRGGLREVLASAHRNLVGNPVDPESS